VPAGAAGGRRFRLLSSVQPLGTPDGTLFLLRAGADDLVIREPETADRSLVELLASGEQSLAELWCALDLAPDAVRAKLDDLDRAGVLATASGSPPLDPADAKRFDRQLPYLADLGDARELQRRLRDARVVVLGCGGLGTWTVAALASAGVGRFTLVDDDRVELSNLNRQILYGTADVGRRKVDATAAWLAAFDERIEVDARELRIDGPGAVGGLVDGADVVVLVADWPPYELARWVSDACVAAGVPLITAGQLPPVLKIGPLYVPGETACFRCHEAALRRAGARYDDYVEQAQRVPARGATLGATSGLVGTALATEILHLLCGVRPASWGQALILDIRTLAVHAEPVAADPTCSVCRARRWQTRSLAP
jgi:bacteriocin biosynthesis cyclodehydratase domain-containing protein